MSGWLSITDTGHAITDPLVAFGNSIVNVLPGILGAILLSAFGYILATFIGLIVRKALVKLGLETWYESTGKHEVLGHLSLSHLISGMIKWYLFALFLVPAVSVVQLDAFAALLTQIALWIPHLLLGILIILAGIIIADIAGQKMSHAKKIGWVRAVIPAIKFVIIVFFIDEALRQIGIDFRLASSTFLIVLGGIVLALALAIGISFGFALRSDVEGFLKHLKKKFD